MKPKTSSWVAELLDTWLKDIDDKEVLDQFIHQIEKRKIALHEQSEAAAFEGLMKTYKDYKFGDTIYMIRPLTTSPVIKGDPWHWYTAKLNKWCPRKEAMRIEVEWKTGTFKDGKHIIYLDRKKLEKYQPSRTRK